MRNLPRPEPNWLQRLLFYVRPKKSLRMRLVVMGEGDLVRVLLRVVDQEGKDRLSRAAMNFAPMSPQMDDFVYGLDPFATQTAIASINLYSKTGRYRTDAEMYAIRLQGKNNELEAVIHRMRCHQEHLDGIIARQDEELKKLRRGGNHPKDKPYKHPWKSQERKRGPRYWPFAGR